MVHAGTVEIRRRENGAYRVLTKLGEGQLIGEMALFRRDRRSADMVATTDVDLLVIKNERLEWLIHNRPEVTMEILKNLSEAVARANQQASAAPPKQ
jgi:CRP-like cAMP-binding protein